MILQEVRQLHDMHRVVEAAARLDVGEMTAFLTYLMQIYSTLRQRNTLGLKFYLLSGETGDAAELLARLGAGGWFQSSYAIIADLAAEMARLKESHHFYPVIFYFRFREPFYSMSKTTELAFETCTLIKSGLSDEKYRWLKNGAAVLALERSTLMLVKLLEHVFLVGRTPEPGEPPNEPTRVRWQERYEGALQRLRAAGIETTADATAGVRAYVELRQQWEPYVQKLIRAGAFRPDEIEREVAQQN